MNTRCVACHRDGGSAPMAFSSYEASRPWAKAIRDEVLTRAMPPWEPVKGFGVFRNDPSLTALEMDMIVQWVEGGAPEGEPQDLPTMPAPMPTAPERGANRWVRLRDQLRLQVPLTAGALRVAAVGPGVEVRILAIKPDGESLDLAWLRAARPAKNRVYEFAEPLPLPAGTVLLISPPEASGIELGRLKIAAPMVPAAKLPKPAL